MGREMNTLLSAADAEFTKELSPNDWPESLVIELRAKRLGCSEDELRNMRSYDLARELADERALQGLPNNEGKAPFIPDWDLCDAIAKREAAQRLKDFEEWRRQRSCTTTPPRKAGSVAPAPRTTSARRE